MKSCQLTIRPGPVGLVLIAAASLLPAFAGENTASDWPMWRCTANRGAATPHELPAELHLQWVRHYPPQRPAWPCESSMHFDRAYHPVVAGTTMFIASSSQDCLIALDVKSGEEKWRFYTDGPVRLAPAGWNGNVYFVSDDGHLRCVDAKTGTLRWKFFGGWTDRKCIGNERMISSWPARGGPVIADGKVYFAAGIWPFMGIFIHALDAKTGNVIWTNSNTGYVEAAPQGHLVVVGDKLLVPCSRTKPVCLDRTSGRFLHYYGAKIHHSRVGNGSWRVWGIGKYFLNDGQVFDLTSTRWALGLRGSSLTDDSAIYYVGKDHLFAVDYKHPKILDAKDKRGKPIKKTVFPQIWKRAFKSGQLWFKTPSRIFTSYYGRAKAVDISNKKGKPQKTWQTKIEGTIADMLAASGRLFVVTSEGAIHCFGPDKVEPRNFPVSPALPAPPADEWTKKAGEILKGHGQREGFCVVLGTGTGRLVEELARQSSLPVVALDPDAKKVNALRRRLVAAGLYGSRVAVHADELGRFEFARHMASLIVSEDLPATLFSKPNTFAERAFRTLRPYGGTAALPLTDAQHGAFAEAVAELKLPKARLKRSAGFTLFVREGALPGSADWSHNEADAGHTMTSRDKTVKAPFGVQWFGGPSDQRIYLDRHSCAPRPQVAGGRIITMGRGALHAIDVYTGRMLWKCSIPGLGASFHASGTFSGGGRGGQGARRMGGSYVSLSDGVYVPIGTTCLRLDPDTGKRSAELVIRDESGKGQMEWGSIGIHGDALIAGADVPFFYPHDERFSDRQLARVSTEALSKLAENLAAQKDLGIDGRKQGEPEKKYLVRSLNTLIRAEDLSAKLGPVFKAMGSFEDRRRRDAYGDFRRSLRAAGKQAGNGKLREAYNRRLMEIGFGLPRKRLSPQRPAIWNRWSSRFLVALDRHTGQERWRRKADRGYPHRAVAIGGGKVFCVDMPSSREIAIAKRRGQPTDHPRKLLAIDIRSGDVLWTVDGQFCNAAFPWSAYSAEHDALVLARDSRITVFEGKTGKMIRQGGQVGAPVMLRGSTVIGRMDFLKGTADTIANPITGGRTSWYWERLGYGCGKVIAGEHLMLFRSGSIGYYDLENHTGVGHINAVRPACVTSAIPANGLLNAPGYGNTCSCGYQLRTSTGLVHMPENEMWTLYPRKNVIYPVQRVGINFGAPGAHMDGNRTFWLRFPAGARTTRYPISIAPEKPNCFRHHSSMFGGGRLARIGASGIQELKSLTITLAVRARKAPPLKDVPFTVRFYFAEPDELKTGDRVFSMTVQGKPFLKDFDIVKEAGDSRKTVVREAKGVLIKGGLSLTFTAAPGSKAGPLLCGFECVREE